jgi:hypothetical protein
MAEQMRGRFLPSGLGRWIGPSTAAVGGLTLSPADAGLERISVTAMLALECRVPRGRRRPPQWRETGRPPGDQNGAPAPG